MKTMRPTFTDILLRRLTSSKCTKQGRYLGTLALILTVGILVLQNAYLFWDQAERQRAKETTFNKESIQRHQSLLPKGSPEDEEFWRSSFDIYGSGELKRLQGIVQSYVNDIRRLRYSLLSANLSWTPVESNWKLLNGYDRDYFAKISAYPQIHTIFLRVNDSLLPNVLAAPKVYNYGGLPEACSVMTDINRAIYPNSKELLNRTCETILKKTLTPYPVDGTLLALGLPLNESLGDIIIPESRLKDEHSVIKGTSILTFIDIIQNGVVTANGEVLTGNVGIMTQRCSHSWYKPQLPADADYLPIYDEVLTITQQTLIWYYHNTIEDLPRIAPYLELLLENPHIKVHITGAGFHETMLVYLGIDPDRLVWGAVRGRVVYLPAGCACGRPNIFNTQLLAAIFRQRIQEKYFQKRIKNKFNPIAQKYKNNENSIQKEELFKQNSIYHPVRQDTILVIKRSSADRQFLNHDSIIATLYDIVNTSGLSQNIQVKVFHDNPIPPIPDYIDAFHRAKIIIAPHGAGLANILFSQQETVIIEGLCEMEPRIWFCFYGIMPWWCYSKYSRVSLSFRNLATVLGQHYVGVVNPDGCLYVTPNDLKRYVEFYLNNFKREHLVIR